MNMRNLMLVLGAAVFTAGSAAAADVSSIDWSSIAAKDVTLFYPGQSSYQWLRSAEHKRADRKVKEGDSCVSCHEGEEQVLGEALVVENRLEPHPVDGKQPTVSLAVQAAYDDTNLYLRFQWETLNPYPGTAHPHWTFKDGAWEVVGAPRLDEEVWGEGLPAIYEDRLSIMLDDGSVPMFAEQGCWVSCHNGSRDMPDRAGKDAVNANPVLGGNLGRSDVRKYLPATRSDDLATWDQTLSVEEIAGIKADGGFLDLMQFRGHRSLPVGMADDGYVLEYRLTDAGTNIFGTNWDKEAKQPKYMFDAAVVGFRSRTLDQIRDLSQPSSLVVGVNAVPFDPNAGWQEGEMIPEYFVNRENASGSAADNTDVSGTWEDGKWTVVWTRALDTGNPADDKIMTAGGVYSVGFAVHDDNITTRGHHVSFPLTIGIGAEADIMAVAQ
jgi:hypothetical protein